MDSGLLESIILRSVFHSNAFGSRRKIDVTLSQERLVVSLLHSNQQVQYFLRNIGGCKLEAGISKKPNSGEQTYTLTLLLFQDQHKSPLSMKTKLVILYAETNEEYETLKKWNVVLQWIANSIVGSKCVEEYCQKNELPPRRRYLVLVNPSSGIGKSLEYYNKQFRPYVDYSCIDEELIVSTSYEDILRVGSSIEAHTYDRVISVGGDGTFSLLMNGVFRNPHCDLILETIKFLLIPTGSGNAVFASLADEFDAKNSPVNLLYSFLRGIPRQSTLSLVKLRCFSPNGEHVDKKAVCVLTTTWGYVSDADIILGNSKSLGVCRETYSALKALVDLKGRPLEIFYFPISEKDDTSDPMDGSLSEKWRSDFTFENRQYYTYIATIKSLLSEDIIISRNQKLCDPNIMLVVITEKIGKLGLLQQFIRKNIQQSFLNQPKEEQKKCIHMQKVRRFFVKGQSGNVMVDGELLHSGSFNLSHEILPQTFMLVSPR